MATNLKGKTARKSRVTILDLALSLGILFGTKVDSSTQDGSFYSSLKFNGEIFRRTHSTLYEEDFGRSQRFRNLGQV